MCRPPSIDSLVGIWCLSLAATLCACSDDEPTRYPYDPGTTNVIGGPRSDDGSEPGSGPGLPGITPVSTFTSPECIELDGDCVVRPHAECGERDATADVILGEDGEVLSVICYPNRDYEVIELGREPVGDVELGNKTVVVIDDVDDGVDIDGDLTVEGNNVIVYGHGPDSSVIGGDLSIDKNNAIVRGVRIQGNTTISKNNASLVYCVIEGDLTITGNNVNLALCEIWGRIQIAGINAVLVSNLVAGDQVVAGINLSCNDNHRFTDTDADGVVDDDDVLAPVLCESRGDTIADDPSLNP